MQAAGSWVVWGGKSATNRPGAGLIVGVAGASLRGGRVSHFAAEHHRLEADGTYGQPAKKAAR